MGARQAESRPARGDAFEQVAVNKLGDEAWATPSLCGDRISFRIATRAGAERRAQLIRIEKP